MQCRILTYNVHGCKGTDGRVSPERIAKVIAQYEPDIVALQELDLGRMRSDEMDQPHLIAKYLGMLYHFHPIMQVEEEQYGNAVLSRHPLKLIKAEKLPKSSRSITFEPRGAMWVSFEVENQQVHLINTHLGLNRRERLFHMKTLLGDRWINHSRCTHPLVLCGDFNSWSISQVCREIRKSLKDVQMDKDNHQPKATWISHFPFSRIDHIFVSPEIKVLNVEVPNTKQNKLASDHLPLIVDLIVQENQLKEKNICEYN